MQRDPVSDRPKGEHILACLSPSPSNPRIVRTAARMAEAFRGSLTALYVRTPGTQKLPEADKERLRANIRLAEELGADIAIVDGQDIIEQIAEFARISGMTIIVLGSSTETRRGFRSPPPLSERIHEITPDMDVHIIPDPSASSGRVLSDGLSPELVLPTIPDLLIMASILTLVTLLGSLFLSLNFTEFNIIPIYMLGVLLISLFTGGYACGVISAVLSVVMFNFFLTEPRFTFHAYAGGYPVTFVIMLAASLIMGTVTSRLKTQVRLSARSAYRAKVLYDTDQLLRQAESEEEILRVTADQLNKLSGRGIAAYPEVDGALGDAVFSPGPGDDGLSGPGPAEKKIAELVLSSGRRAGSSDDPFPDSPFLFLPLRIRSRAYGVIGLDRREHGIDLPLDSILLSILGECALAIENNRNHKEKQEAAVRARNEQIRADLLRSISHDLRTPLTSISGNADTLLSSYELLNDEARKQVFTDIREDARWLIGLVENLLAVTKLQDGKMQLRLSPQPAAEVIEEALRHVYDRGGGHVLRAVLPAEDSGDLLFARMDAGLIMQVIINLADNAVKYTPAGTVILAGAYRQNDRIMFFVSDNGTGIPDEDKPHVFEMFYTGRSGAADSRRSLGLGLSLCRTIVQAHGGELTLRDNEPHGTVFEFSLPAEEVMLNDQNEDTGRGG